MKPNSSDTDRAPHEATARVSSPASTGGAGTTFEQHVGAYWLAQLLVGAIPPILINTTVVEVNFQTERLGWHTDDFLVVCNRCTDPTWSDGGEGGHKEVCAGDLRLSSGSGS